MEGDYTNIDGLSKEETGDLIISLLMKINYLETELFEMRETYRDIEVQRGRGLLTEVDKDEKASLIVSTLKQINDLQLELYKARKQFENLCVERGIPFDNTEDEMER